MRKRNRSDLLLVEILIAVFFFMLSLTALVQVFAASRNMTVKAQARTQAIAQAQNVADSLTGSEDPNAVLEELGFKSSHGIWTQNYGSYSLMASGDFSPYKEGRMWQGKVTAYYNSAGPIQERTGEDELLSLPCVWYRRG